MVLNTRPVVCQEEHTTGMALPVALDGSGNMKFWFAWLEHIWKADASETPVTTPADGDAQDGTDGGHETSSLASRCSQSVLYANTEKEAPALTCAHAAACQPCR